MGSCQRTSARTSCSSGVSPARLHSPASGSSRRVAAKAPFAAMANKTNARPTPTAPLAVAQQTRWRNGAALTVGARWRPRCQSGLRPQTPTTTKRQRRARTSRFRRAACSRASPGCTSALGCASPARVTGLTMVASTACCAPCHRASPLATSSRRRSSETSTSMFMSAKRTLRATRAPASWHTRATAFSRGRAREARTLEVAHAALWSPSGSGRPRQAHVRGATGSGRRNRQRSKTRKCAEGTVNFADVGKTVRARAACGPACDHWICNVIR